jgi:hypothetical protein
MSISSELEGLLEFLYVCPVGIVEFDNAGRVSLINPKAANLLASRLGFIDLEEFFPVLHEVAPDLVGRITASVSCWPLKLTGWQRSNPSSTA